MEFDDKNARYEMVGMKKKAFIEGDLIDFMKQNVCLDLERRAGSLTL